MNFSKRRSSPGALFGTLLLLASCAGKGVPSVQPLPDVTVTEDTTLDTAIHTVLEAGSTFDSFELAEATNTVSVSDAGVVYDDVSAAERNTKILTKLIKNAKDNTCVKFDGGTLYLAAGKFGCLPISGKNGLYLQGNGTRLINVSYTAVNGKTHASYHSSVFLPIRDSRNITLDGFELDHLHHTDAEGTIIRQTDEKTYVKLSDEYRSGEKAPIEGGEYVAAASFFDGDTVASDEHYYPDEVDSFIEFIGDGEIAVPYCRGNVGQNIALRFSFGNYASPLIPVHHVSSLTVRDVTVHSSPSSVVYAPCGNADFCFERFRVVPYEGADTLYASNADCIHIKGLRGRLILHDCEFVGIGDDALNVHSRAALITAVEGNTVTALDGYDKGRLPDGLFYVGDCCEFYNPNGRSFGKAVITAVKGNKVTFDALPEKVGEDMFIQNLAWTPLTYIENCHVERSRARGFLLQTKNAVVKDCRFDNIRLSGILISPDFRYWYECGFSDNVLIENCAFHQCGGGLGDRGFGVITASACHDKPVPIAGKPHGNILLRGNTFTDCVEPWKMYGVASFVSEDDPADTMNDQ